MSHEFMPMLIKLLLLHIFTIHSSCIITMYFYSRSETIISLSYFIIIDEDELCPLLDVRLRGWIEETGWSIPSTIDKFIRQCSSLQRSLFVGCMHCHICTMYHNDGLGYYHHVLLKSCTSSNSNTTINGNANNNQDNDSDN